MSNRHVRWLGVDRPTSPLSRDLLALGTALNFAHRHALGIDPDSVEARARVAALDLLEHGMILVDAELVIPTLDQLHGIRVQIDGREDGLVKLELLR